MIPSQSFFFDFIFHALLTIVYPMIIGKDIHIIIGFIQTPSKKYNIKILIIRNKTTSLLFENIFIIDRTCSVLGLCRRHLVPPAKQLGHIRNFVDKIPNRILV